VIRVDLQWFAEKTEPATEKRRGEERQEGRVARSPDLTSAFAFMAFLGGMMLYGNSVLQGLWNLAVYAFSNGVIYASASSHVPPDILQLLEQIVTPLAYIMLIAIGAALIVAYRQVGQVFSAKPLIPDFTRLNPFTGFGKLFSISSLFTLGKSTVQLGFIALALYLAVFDRGLQIYGLMGADPVQIFQFYASSAETILLSVAGMFLALSIADYVFQRFRFERGIRMSKQDVKDERKQAEGDPTVKREIRKKGYSLAFRRMMRKVPTADVVITNPTHFAVALKYDGQTMHAPQVVAKGVDATALRIKEIARENGVAIVENRSLARALYNQVELEAYVPNQLFQAVAEVLAYVYRLRQTAR